MNLSNTPAPAIPVVGVFSAVWVAFWRSTWGAERAGIIREKVVGYWRAVEASTEDYFPYVVFVVRDLVRKREIERIFRRQSEGQQEMVRVFLFGELIPELMRL